MVLLPPNIIPSPTSPLTSLRLKKEKNRVWKLGNGLLTALFPHPSLQWALGILEGHGDIFEGSWQGAWKAEEAIRTVGDRHVKHPASQEMSWLLKGLGAWNADDWGEVFKKRSSLVFSGGDKHMDTLKLISHTESLDHNIVIPKMPFGIYLQSKAAFLCHLMGERGRCSTTLTIWLSFLPPSLALTF